MADADTEAINAAEALLRNIPEYDWLTKGGLQWWTIPQLAEHLPLGEAAIRARIREFPGAQDYGEKIGYRIPRSGVILYLARILVEQQRHQDAG
ncbi:MAG: hypothetical protein KGH75_00515 [Rhodospirillales bacterium]|nr:hypothetical protein [Rhodospirillales bacterium]